MIPTTQDVTVSPGNAGTMVDAGPSDADYAHVAKRRHGVLALAEARGFGAGQAEAAVDRLADEMESCLAAREAEGKLVNGAARVVVRLDVNGAIDGFNVHAAPGAAVTANLLVCLVAPLKAGSFGAGPVRGFALEAEWSPVGSAPPAASAAAP